MSAAEYVSIAIAVISFFVSGMLSLVIFIWRNTGTETVRRISDLETGRATDRTEIARLTTEVAVLRQSHENQTDRLDEILRELRSLRSSLLGRDSRHEGPTG